ncbi:S41 family peptidase [Vagococcus sp. PNs007]|uniref:S41 family peptidase n=1 Tax=Vagococcus proximus TaxID=2991417 RepID=A0ABT5WZB0_9ENTE|nr:S41 family peptidase [Vagococcus proximus]MDF0479102.1 S41 family peptidase [Vagococcus proximus]
MTKRKRPDVPYKQYIISLICMGIIAGGGAYKITEMRYDQERNQLATVMPHFDEMMKINTTYETIRNSYVGKVKNEELVDGAIKGMTQALNDPYSDYFSGKEFDELNETISGSFAGIGAVMTVKDNNLVIAEPPVKNSPAEKALLKAEDIILKVNGKATKGKELSEVVKEVRGEKGTKVKLTIQRGEEIFDKSLVRDDIPVETVFGAISKDNNKIGSIIISNFSERTAVDLKDQIEVLRKEGAQAFIIDLRQNPGGLLDQVAEMSSMFLKDGKTIVQFEDKDGNKEALKANKGVDKGFKVKEPVVVLVDEGSASASEIFAAALNESAGVPIIGTKTFGKGTVQTVQPLSEESELKLTTNKWLTPKGNWIHKKGLEPTIATEYPDFAYLAPIGRDMTYQEGMTGKVMVNINGILAGIGYEVDAKSDKYDAQTKTAVSEHQKKFDLPVTGEIDNDTAHSLEKELAKKIIDNDETMTKALEEIVKKIN